MRALKCLLSLVLFLSVFLVLSGCGGSAGAPAAPPTTMGEIEEFLQENPEMNTDELDEDMEEEEEL